MKLKWITNVYDLEIRPEYVNAYNKNHKSWLKDKIIGEPKASEKYTVEQLKEMGLVGVYVKEEGDK